MLAWTTALTAAPVAREQPRGLPFIRTYPLDEIGNVPRGLRLGFDAFGRVAVMYDGVYSVLNDSAWVDRTDKTTTDKTRMTTLRVADGKYYYGARGSWGEARLTPEGRLRPAPMVPADAPVWTSVTAFNHVLPTATGVYFYELNGVVYWDFARRQNVFFPMPRLSAAIPVGDRVYVSCQDNLIRELLPVTGEARVVPVPALEGEAVLFAVALDRSHALLALRNGRLFTFDGNTATPWPSQSEHGITGRITAMERLVEGGVALALADQGVMLFAADGTLRWSLSVPEVKRVGSMAAGEPGVLWVAGENALHRIYYDSPLTSFGQQLGITAVWPHVGCWNDKIVISSNSTLYEMNPALPGHPPTFRELAGHATSPSDFIAASGPHLLAGNAQGVFSVAEDRARVPLIQIENVAGLEFIEPDTCIVVGSREIAALRKVDGRWIECAPRIAGVGDAPIHIQKYRQESLWIEMGGDRVARLTLRHGTLELQRIALPWHGEQWSNVGVLGDMIILTGVSGQRTYYDETRQTLGAAPRLDELLNRSPYWVLRIKEDEAGVLWATHAQGVVTFTPDGNDYAVDSSTFELLNDSYPTVTVLPGDNIWIGAGRSLYHVERRAPRTPTPVRTVLVSLMADQKNRELINQAGAPAFPPQFDFDDSSLSFRFFSGTYAWRTPPSYEYRLASSEPWTPVDRNLVLRFPKLRDGSYLLEVRQAGPRLVNSPTFAFAFVINPPWYRTPASYAVAAVVLLLAVLGVARWINHRSLNRNAALERVVHERTRELEVAMQKLGEETRNAATLAERSRLAGEIHDSVQQGLSGAILHLDTTMTHPSIIPEVHSSMHVVRNMLSYSREEVQQAVWNLESPLLQKATLGDALRKLAGYIRPGSIEVDTDREHGPGSLDSMVRHNLLRIAQEAITNAVKHAEAGLIRVTLQSQPGALILRVTDNGKGFDATTPSLLDGHFGLRGIRARAKSIKADLQIITSPGAGTTVQVSVPLTTDSFP